MKELKEYIIEGIFDIDNNIDQAGDVAVVKNFIKKNYTVRNYTGDIDVNIKEWKTKDGKFIVDSQYADITVINKSIKSLTNGMFVWGIVGNFYCDYCTEITSLEGAPEEVSWNFSCCGCNSLKSLKGAPTISPSSFDCSECDLLKNLEGSPKKTKSFNCKSCKSLKSLKGAPRELSNFDCSQCISLDSLTGSPKKVSDTFKCAKCAKMFDSEYIHRYCGKPKFIFTW